MPVCSEMPWGGPFHGAHGFGRGWGGRGGFGCGRGGFMGRGVGMGPWGMWAHHVPRHCHPHHHGPPPPHHHGHPPHPFHHHGPPPHHPPPPHHGPHHPPHHGPPPPHPHCPPHHHHHGPHHGPHGPHHGGRDGPCGGPQGRFGGCRGGLGGGPMRGRGGCGPRGRGRMSPWRWGPPGMGPRHWHCRPGAFDAPFDDALLVAMLLNFDLPVFSRDGDTGEDVPPAAAAAPSAPEEPEQRETAETNIIRIDTRRFTPEDIRVSFSDGQLRVTAVHTDENGEQVTLRRSAALRAGSKVTARLGADGFLYIRAEEPAARTVNVEVVVDGEN